MCLIPIFNLFRQGQGENRLSAALFRCPEGYLYDPSKRRCQPEEGVQCSKVPDLGRIAREPRPIQLR